ncbi:hypothetical protein NFJ02_16g25670 [Pycnococcus provasolii]
MARLSPRPVALKKRAGRRLKKWVRSGEGGAIVGGVLAVVVGVLAVKEWVKRVEEAKEVLEKMGEVLESVEEVGEVGV